MKKIIILTVLLVSVFANENKKDHSFLDIMVSDPKVQQDIDMLKQQYIDEAVQVRTRYQKRIDGLKKQRRGEIETLKNAYKKRLKKIKKEYPRMFNNKPEKKPLKATQPQEINEKIEPPLKKRGIK